MKRKGFTRLLSCALLLSVLLGALVFPVSAATQFVDVYPGMLSREYFDAINYIVDNGIMNGTDSTHFSPYQNITRGMFVTIKGSHQNTFQLYMSNQGVTTDGIVGNTECGFSSKNSISAKTAQLFFTEISHFDLSNVANSIIKFSTQDNTKFVTLSTDDFIRIDDYE